MKKTDQCCVSSTAAAHVLQHDDVHTHWTNTVAATACGVFAALSVNAIMIDATLEFASIDPLCFVLTPLPGPPRCCEKTSEAAFRSHIRLLKAKQITPEGPAPLFYNIIGLAIVLSLSAGRISGGRHMFASVACSVLFRKISVFLSLQC